MSEASWPTRLVGRPAGVVFDCDGLLVDTEPSWERAEAAIFARRGVPYGPEDHQVFLGSSVAATAAMIAERFGEPHRAAEIGAEILDTVGELLAREATAMPGAVALVTELAVRGVPIGVASNSPRQVVEFALGIAGLGDSFAVVISADEVAAPKPAPDPYRLACERLGIQPARAVAFEDSATGLTAATAAGMATIGVPSHPGELPADWIVASLDDPKVADWLASW